MSYVTRCVVVGLSLASFHATADAEIIGKPRIIDANTIEIAGQTIGLYGIEAPEEGQTCNADGREWRCGQQAAFALATIIESHWIYCIQRDADRFGNILAICHLSGPNGPDVNAEMVRRGWAGADRGHSTDYVALETEARKSNVGIWRGGW